MNGDRSSEDVGLGTAVLIVSPVAVIVGVLMAMAVGHDFLHSTGEVPIALGLSAPAVFLGLRRAVPLVRSWHAASHAGSPALAGDARELDRAP